MLGPTQNVKLSWQTDVWSFGVVLWEMLSPVTVDAEMLQQLGRLEDNEVYPALKRWYDLNSRLGKQINCPAKMYEIMKMCWNDVPDSRPGFAQLSQLIGELMENELE